MVKPDAQRLVTGYWDWLLVVKNLGTLLSP